MANIYELLNLGIDPRPQFQNLDEVKSAIESKTSKKRAENKRIAGNRSRTDYGEAGCCLYGSKRECKKEY